MTDVNITDFSLGFSDCDYIFLLHFPCCSMVSKWLRIVIPVVPKNPSVIKTHPTWKTQRFEITSESIAVLWNSFGTKRCKQFLQRWAVYVDVSMLVCILDSRIYEPQGNKERSSQEQKTFPKHSWDGQPQAKPQRILWNIGSRTTLDLSCIWSEAGDWMYSIICFCVHTCIQIILIFPSRDDWGTRCQGTSNWLLVVDTLCLDCIDICPAQQP